MIRVEITYQGDDFLSLTIHGHGSQGYGKDLVCAGVSTCFVGAMNALEQGENFDFQVSSGDSLCRAKTKPNRHDDIVLETLIVQLKTIEHRYPNDCSVRVLRKEG
jgi:uncharacterized protein YsxB (DUF464 family)